MRNIEIKGYEQYAVTSCGKVWSYKSNKFLKPHKDKKGYYRVNLSINGKLKNALIHRLVAIAYIPNPCNKPQVNHIDGNKTNNSLKNLEWNTPRENVMHARRTGLQKSDGDKIVSCFDLLGNKVCTYKSASYASRITGIGRANICSVARGNTKQKTAGGYIWKYE